MTTSIIASKRNSVRANNVKSVIVPSQDNAKKIHILRPQPGAASAYCKTPKLMEHLEEPSFNTTKIQKLA